MKNKSFRRRIRDAVRAFIGVPRIEFQPIVPVIESPCVETFKHQLLCPVSGYTQVQDVHLHEENMRRAAKELALALLDAGAIDITTEDMEHVRPGCKLYTARVRVVMSQKED